MLVRHEDLCLFLAPSQLSSVQRLGAAFIYNGIWYALIYHVLCGAPNKNYGIKESRLVFCVHLRKLAKETVLKCSKEIMTVTDGFQLHSGVSSASPRRVASEPGGTCATWAGLVWRGDLRTSKAQRKQNRLEFGYRVIHDVDQSTQCEVASELV